MMHGYGFGGIGWIEMIILFFMIAVMIGIVLLVIWLVRRTDIRDTPNIRASSASQSPREILQARYARGEINREQYLEILEDLNRNN
jgi:putative membrane protein